MTKFTLSVLACLSFAAAATAQPTLTAATNAPVNGDMFIGSQCDTTGAGAGATGAGVTWNFGSLVEVGSDTETFYTCSLTPYCDSFTGANLAMETGSTDYDYINSTSTDVSIIGEYAVGGPFIHAISPLLLMHFPLTYGTTYSNYAAANINITDPFPLTVYHTQTDSFTADAWGTLTIPSGTYANCIRVKDVSTSSDSVNIFGMPNVTTNTTTSYQWFAPGFHFMLLTVGYDTTGAPAPYVSNVEYYRTPGTTAVKNVVASTRDLQLFPNPATDAVTLKCNISDPATSSVTITDLTGRQVASIDNSQLTAGANNINYSLSSVPAGMYLVTLRTSAGNTTQKLVVSK